MTSKKEKSERKREYMLGEETLNLSPTDFEKFISGSKAKPNSIKRYYREYDRYNKNKIKSKEIVLPEGTPEISVNEYIQKEIGRNISRKVILTGIDCNILVKRKFNKLTFRKIKRLFNRLYEYKSLSTAMTLKVMFVDIIHSVTYTTPIYVSTTLYTVTAFDLAFNELVYKINSILNKYPDRDILIKRCIIKFYYKRQEGDKNTT